MSSSTADRTRPDLDDPAHQDPAHGRADSEPDHRSFLKIDPAQRPGTRRPALRVLKRRAILDAARRLFIQEGYAGASISQIAAEVGGSKGTLYAHFDSKADIFLAVIQDCAVQMERSLDAFEVPDGDLGAALRAIGRHYVREMLLNDRIAMMRTLIAEAERFPEIGEAIARSGTARGLPRLASLLTQAIRRGDLAVCDAAAAAEKFLDLALAGLLLRSLWASPCRASEAEIDATVEDAVQVFLRAYTHPHTPTRP